MTGVNFGFPINLRFDEVKTTEAIAQQVKDICERSVESAIPLHGLKISTNPFIPENAYALIDQGRVVYVGVFQ